MYVFIFLLTAVNWQNDWTGGSTVLGPVADWGSKFWQSDSVTINTPHQISSVVSGTVNPYGWTKHIIETDPKIWLNSIWPADFDNDGHIDLAGWKSNNGYLVFYKNNGSDSFVKVDSFAGPSQFQPWGFIYGADLDNDGKIDVVVPCGDAGAGLWWYKNNGGFNFTRDTVSIESNYYDIDGADIDKSGNISLVATRGWKDCIEIWKNSGGGHFTCIQTPPDSAWRARFVDVNNDGYPDLVVGNQYTNPSNYRVLLNDGTGYFNTTPNDTFYTNLGNDELWDADMNNDGSKDLIVGLYQISWMQNNGLGTGWTKHIVHTGDSYYGDGGCAEDFDFDGKADIASGYDCRLAWFKQVNPDSFTPYVIDSLPSSTYTHWIVPFKMGSGSCFKRGAVNLLVCWGDMYSAFVWYENKMVSGLSFSNGSLQSSILKGKCDSTNFKWLYFGWKTCCPFTNAISFQFRSGTDSANILSKSFSTAVQVTPATQFDSVDLSPYVLSGDSFFQYLVNFTSGSDAGIVDSVWVTYTCSGAGINENSNLKEFLKVYPGKICYSLIQNSKIKLSLYTVSGRLVRTLDKGEKSKGGHWINIPELPAGLYLAVLNINGRNLTKKIVVVK